MQWGKNDKGQGHKDLSCSAFGEKLIPLVNLRTMSCYPQARVISYWKRNCFYQAPTTHTGHELIYNTFRLCLNYLFREKTDHGTLFEIEESLKMLFRELQRDHADKKHAGIRPLKRGKGDVPLWIICVSWREEPYVKISFYASLPVSFLESHVQNIKYR